MYANPQDPRDHRHLGRDRDLFALHPAAPGGVLWRPKGWAMMARLRAVAAQANQAAGYAEVQSPDVLDRALWERSGHWEAYGAHMMPLAVEGKDLALKPMNCPGHALLFNLGPRHESALPVRLAEFGRVHRNEPSGALHGLLRLRSFTQDDGHAFCAPHQVAAEIARLDKVARALYAALGFAHPRVALSLRPQARVGSDAQWDGAEEALRAVLDASGHPYAVQPGEGAFYGPKVEYALEDGRGRLWQCGTIQLDFQLPDRFGCSWLDAEQRSHPVVLIHRAFLGSLERFFAVLMERDAPHLPAWLAPLGVAIVPVRPEHREHAHACALALAHKGVDAVVWNADGPLGGRMKAVESADPAYVWVVGDREVASNGVAMRAVSHSKPESMGLDDACARASAGRALPSVDVAW